MLVSTYHDVSVAHTSWIATLSSGLILSNSSMQTTPLSASTIAPPWIQRLFSAAIQLENLRQYLQFIINRDPRRPILQITHDELVRFFISVFSQLCLPVTCSNFNVLRCFERKYRGRTWHCSRDHVSISGARWNEQSTLYKWEYLPLDRIHQRRSWWL